MKKRALIVFAKEPRGAEVKTRLENIFSEEERLLLYRFFLKDTYDFAVKLSCSLKVLAFDSKTRPWELEEIFSGFVFYQQKGFDLGERMHNAFSFAKHKPCDKIVLIGTDSPDLPPLYIEQAFDRLDQRDVVLGPCQDGGYYLIGLKQPNHNIFQGIGWSGKDVLSDTIKKIKENKLTHFLLDKWYDVDNPQDFNAFKKRVRWGKTAKHTRKYIYGK